MTGMRSFALLALVACGGGQTPIEVVTVQALRTPCQGFGADMCLTMQPDFEPPEQLFFEIEGYTHRWGVEAELRIHREQVEPVPDGPSELIVLDEILIEREPITAPFELVFPASGSQWFVAAAEPRHGRDDGAVRSDHLHGDPERAVAVHHDRRHVRAHRRSADVERDLDAVVTSASRRG